MQKECHADFVVAAYNPTKYAVPIQQPLILPNRPDDPDLRVSHKGFLIRCQIWFNRTSMLTAHSVVILLNAQHSFLRRYKLCNYPQLTPGDALEI